MGGALAQYTATKEANVGAAVSFYGGFKKVAMRLVESHRADHADLRRERSGRADRQGPRAGEAARGDGQGRAPRSSIRTPVTPSSTTPAKNYNAEAAADAWQRTIAFFRAQLT